ncbi:MAG TPA: hypothetical protein VM238_14305 [Phycisphaerae bacterium]|jgi:hypothetical protein|nr:hypothetical protein [Phycisphaerae bacterium]HUU92367.1 hypothetical protein [Phycisphaerae bacterium]
MLTHQGITWHYLTSVGNSGTPPWRTPDGTGGWGGNHGQNTAVATDEKRDDGRYEARRQTEAGPTFGILGPESVRIMRARYPLCRDHFARSLESYGYADRQRILADFFPHGLWRPK